MPTYGDEYHIGHVASQKDYDASWSTPTWAEFGDMLQENDVDEFVLIPLGKIGSPKREFGSTGVHVSFEDMMNVLNKTTRNHMQEVFPGGDPNNSIDVLAASGIIARDSTFSNEMMEELANLKQKIVHLTGIAIKVIR